MFLLIPVAVIAVLAFVFTETKFPHVVDDRVDPRASGSYSSVVTAVASSGPDPYIEERPVQLGGRGAFEAEERTFGSLEEEATQNSESMFK